MRKISLRTISKLFIVGTIVISILVNNNFIVSSFAANQSVIYVSPTGSDSNSGTINSPYKTIEKARDIVRTLNSNMSGDIIVYLRGGTYNLTSPIEFNELDSGSNGYKISYTSYTGEEAIISGGEEVTGWTQYSGDIYKANYNHDGKIRQLWVDGERATIASTDYISGQGLYGTVTIQGTEDWAFSSGTESEGLQFSFSELSSITNPEDAEITSQSGFTQYIVGLSNISSNGSYMEVEFQQPAGSIALSCPEIWGMGFMNKDNKFRIQNAFEYLDEEGEFYFNDVTNELFYYQRSDETMANVEAIVPVSEGLISLKGTSILSRIENIEFSGIKFTNDHWLLEELSGSYGSITVQSNAMYDAYSSSGDWHEFKYTNTHIMQSAIEVENADNIDFTRNTFENLGSSGLTLLNDTNNCDVTGNLFLDIGGAGISIGDPKNVYIEDGDFGANVEGVPCNNSVTNNYIYEAAAEAKQTVPITVYFTESCEISHNEIKFAPYSGMSIGWGFNACYVDTEYGYSLPTSTDNIIVSNNLVEDVMRELHDGAGIYTLGNYPNSEISGNYINRVGGKYGGNAIYTDQSSAYFEIMDNVTENYKGAYWFVWGENARVHDIYIHDIYADTIYGSEGDYATDSTKTNISSTWSSATTLIAENAGLELTYEDIRPAALYQSISAGTIEAEDCVFLGRAKIKADTNASGGQQVETIDLLGDGLRLGVSTEKITGMTIYYASIVTGTYGLYANGIRVEDISFTSNGSWNGSYTTVKIDLDAPISSGSVIELRCDIGDSGLNIDKIDLTSIGGTYLEAEDATMLGRAEAYTDSNASGGGGVHQLDTLGDGIEFTNMAAADYLTIDYASIYTGTYSIYVDGSHVKDFNFTSTGSWFNTYSSVEVEVDIPENSTLKLQRDSGDSGLNIDRIALSSASAIYEGESATMLGRAAAYTDNNASGDGGAQYLDLVGDGIEFSSVFGGSTLTIYYASMNSGTYSIYVNGTHLSDISFASNGVWYGSYISTSVAVTIPDGAALKLQRDSNDSGLNIDYIVIE